MSTTNQAKAFFQACRRLDARISALTEERVRIMAMATRCTPTYSDMPHASGTSNPVEQAVVRLDELDRRLAGEIDFYVRLRGLASEVVRRLPDSRYQEMLTLRYLNGYSWGKVAETMGYESNYIWRVHGSALLEARQILAELSQDEGNAALIERACTGTAAKQTHAPHLKTSISV